MTNERYLFRGKRVDTGEWLQGDLSQLPRGTFIFTPLKTFFGSFDHCQVDPATIGQCTGLRDKNGTLVWEGDIVEVTPLTYCEEWPQTETNRKYPHIVEWKFDGREPRLAPFNHSYREIEIIGNVHDDSELLEVSK